jgi:hypothetical protein
MVTMRPATSTDVFCIEWATEHLRVARDLLKKANAPKTLARVRLALSSAKGARRHVQHRVFSRRAS